MAYATLQVGDSGADVRTLKRLLNSAGFRLEENDVFDEDTGKAVSAYQSANRLTASGAADAPTWAKLAANAVTAMPKNQTAAQKTAYLEENRPAAYTSDYAQKLDDMLNQVLTREGFSYDPAEDELYKRYRDEYLSLGQRAMNDARGQAAALTGGYDNSYAESAGQQAFQNYASQAADALPELFRLALSAYDAETDRLSGNLSALTDADEAAYRRYRDDVEDYEAALKYYYQKAKDEGGAKKSSGGGGSAKTAAAPEIPAGSLLTESEFNRRKAAGAQNLKPYLTYANYLAAMKRKYTID